MTGRIGTPKMVELNIYEVVEYLRGKWNVKKSVDSVRHAAYRTHKLALPVLVDNRAYWTPEQVDAWVRAMRSPSRHVPPTDAA